MATINIKDFLRMLQEKQLGVAIASPIERATMQHHDKACNTLCNSNATFDQNNYVLSEIIEEKNATLSAIDMQKDDATTKAEVLQEKQNHFFKSEDLLYQFQERLAIMIHDGKLSEKDAIDTAFLEFVTDNMNNIKC